MSSWRGYLFNDLITDTGSRQPALDLVRFLAALMVLLFHYRLYRDVPLPLVSYSELSDHATFPLLLPILKFGYLGVNLFFMVSGYVIFMSCARKSGFEFALGRMVRLLPGYWLALIVTFSLSMIFFDNPWEVSAVDFILNFSMMQPYLNARYVDPVYWTLVVELHFYFLIFVLLISRQIKAWRLWLSLWLLVSLLGEWISYPPIFHALILDHYGGYFIAGMIAYSWNHRAIDVWSVLVYLLSFVQTLFYLPEQLQLYNFGYARGWELSVVFLLNALAFLLFALMARGQIQFSSSKWLIFVGGITYPLYLVHHEIGRQLLNRLSDYMPAIFGVPLVILVVLTLAVLIYQIADLKIQPRLKGWIIKVKEKRESPAL